MSIGERIAELRAQRGITQRDLADEVRITRGALSNIETGKSQPQGGTLYRLAQALGTTVGDLEESPKGLFDSQAYKKGVLYEVIENILGSNSKRFDDCMRHDKGLARAIAMATHARKTSEQERELANAAVAINQMDEGPAIKIRPLEDQGNFGIGYWHARGSRYPEKDVKPAQVGDA